MTGHASFAELEGRVDPFLLRRMSKQDAGFALRTLDPVPTWNRFDLGFKLLWLDARMGARSQFAERIYQDHIAAFSLADMAEPGNPDKQGIARFRSDFAGLLQDMRAHGFDASKSLVPLAGDGSLLNAGHRSAVALALGKPVTAVETGLDPVHFDYDFFARRGMAQSDLDAAAVRMVEAMPDVAVALLWPAARGREREAARLMGPLVYRRSLQLSLKAGHLLLSRVYRDEPWLGPAEENFPGIRRKLMACFNGPDPLRVLIFDAPTRRDRVALKAEVRRLYGIDKSSIHITDTQAEAVEIAHLLLNPAARHFLSHGDPMAFAETRHNIASLQAYMKGNALGPASLAVDTGMVLGLYGLRPPSDVDVIADGVLPSGPIEHHDTNGHDAAFGDLIQDPALHFRYDGITWLSLAEVAALKSRRLAGQDREDLLRIKPLLASPSDTAEGRLVSLRFQFALLRLRRRVIRGLMALGIGRPLRRVYRHFLRKSP
ncbi:hypothetical protein [Antarctobacter sp.]|uniref:hypothetical protein n=1 Tax=Antarctobacter sp. TaxID=1872577 RepID=UPI003A8E6184